jgi:hypothetical protein
MAEMNDQDRVRLDRIEESLTTLTIKFDKVYYAITGNELDGNRGIVYRLDKVEEKTNKMERDFDRIKWTVIAWGIAAGVFSGSAASTLISRLFAN